MLRFLAQLLSPIANEAFIQQFNVYGVLTLCQAAACILSVQSQGCQGWPRFKLSEDDCIAVLFGSQSA